ncbi:MAG TPA: class II aldolase/adducin family protein [Thauera sp.]|jgi:L-fuculose-phosphate aldolase|uniref:class II aldolase/adducin family protein n=1 Tax=Thauera sp. TaxID=1905334 RepID=UPI0026323506|nr:class II aldolase/adducin family protein [Thauera sp.]MCP5225623.1 class II aldolase/adducin family protein [Thauera sp.]HPE04909.1 class II aldolase/adducin family protein [Thauera sp.]HRV77603.1 class II aldolase/adducin family protein [Thauera sp.]
MSAGTPGCIHEEAGWRGEDDPRARLLHTLRAMGAARLNVGTSGNASQRLAGGRMLISPSGIAAERCRAEDMVVVEADGRYAGARAPSSEWQLHHDVYAAFPAAGAVLHAHAPFATALACQRLDIQPFHYMIARFGGTTVRCARYATFGTQALSEATVAALHERSACLLANHGMVVFGRDLEHALAMAVEFETLCEQYWRTLQLGAPVLLSEAEMAEVIERFKWYGKPRA